jgi:hypothetical protein
MIKNTRNNRLMGSIDGLSDVSYRLFVRDFIEDIEFSRPFAVTLTMNSVQWRSHSQNFRHFMNRLNQSFLKSGYRRYGKKILVTFNEETRTHTLKLRLKLPLVGDDFKWTDKKQSPYKYKISEGSYEKETEYSKQG